MCRPAWLKRLRRWTCCAQRCFWMSLHPNCERMSRHGIRPGNIQRVSSFQQSRECLMGRSKSQLSSKPKQRQANLLEIGIEDRRTLSRRCTCSLTYRHLWDSGMKVCKWLQWY
jgi:hypothetical protein